MELPQTPEQDMVIKADSKELETTPSSDQPVGEIKSMPKSTAVLIGPNQREVDKSLANRVRIFLLPIVAVSVLLGFLLFGIIPNVSRVFGIFDEIGVLREEYEKEAVALQILQVAAGETSVTTANIELINSLAGLEGVSQIVDFQEKIAGIARENNLRVLEQKTSENIIGDDDEQVEAPPVGIIEIPSDFSLEGTLSQVRSFINRIATVDDFIIIGSMELRARNQSSLDSSSSQLWQLEISLIKYVFQEADSNNQLAQIYLNVPIEKQPDPQVLDFIRGR